MKKITGLLAGLVMTTTINAQADGKKVVDKSADVLK